MNIIVLAGGFGTRLRSVVKEIPKPMAPINGKPFLEILLDSILKFPIEKILLSVGYKWEMIQEHFGDDFKGVPIEYIVENEPLGTGGAIALAMQNINDDVIVLNGDTLFKIDLIDLYEKHNLMSSEVTLAVKDMKDPHRYGTVELQGNRVVRFIEKQQIDSGIINCGVYVINKNILSRFPEGKFSFEMFMQENVNSLMLNAVKFDDYFIDMGIPEDYQKLQDDLNSLK